MFHILPDHFFILLSTPGKIVYWDCICKLFTIMDNQLSFGVEREVLVSGNTIPGTGEDKQSDNN